MQSHHEEYPFETTEAVIVQVADAISSQAGRQKGFFGKLSQTLGRLGKYRQIVRRHRKTYAIQAG